MSGRSSFRNTHVAWSHSAGKVRVKKSHWIAIGVAALAVALVAGALLYKPAADGTSTESGKTSEEQVSPQDGTVDEPAEGAAPSQQPPKIPEQAAPITPAPTGKKLKTMTEPPEDTLAMIEPQPGLSGAKYDVTFRPYGTDPMGVVIAVSKSVPQAKTAAAADFNDRNVVVRFAVGVSGSVRTGGTYTGVIQLREEAGLLVPYLISAKSR